MSGKNNRYGSVVEMTRAVSADPSFTRDLETRLSRRQLAKRLFALRTNKGLSQREVAERLGCSQSRVSKLEASEDEDLRLGDLRAYLRAIGLDLALVVAPTERTAVGLIKFHALSIKRLINHLASLAQGDERIATGVADFYGEAFFNLVKMLQDAANKLPKNTDDRPFIQIELVELDEEEGTSRDRAAAPGICAK